MPGVIAYHRAEVCHAVGDANDLSGAMYDGFRFYRHAPPPRRFLALARSGSVRGKPTSGDQIRRLIGRRTKRDLGHELCPLLLRKLPPTELAINDPEHVGIAQALLGRALENEKAANPDARDLVMRGLAFLHRPLSAANRWEARRAFERALEIDPKSVNAQIGLATVFAVNVIDGLSRSAEEDKARAEQLLLEVFERGANSSRGHEAMGGCCVGVRTD